MGVSAGDFSASDVDLDLDMGLWPMPTMPDPAVDYSHGDIGPTAMTGSEPDEMGHHVLGSAHRAPQNTPATTLLNGLCGPSSSMPISSSVSEEIAPTSLATPSAPTLASSSHQCSQDGTCYKTLSGLLTTLGDLDLSPAEPTQLDGLLCIDRELQQTVRLALDCGHCTEMPSNQNLLMVIYMAIDSLLSLFEKQQRQQPPHDSSGSANAYHNPSSSTATAAAAVAGPRRYLMPHAPKPSSRCPHDKSDDTGSRGPRQFPWTELSLVVGNFPVDDAVKASFLQRLVLDYIDNVLALLAELEKMADTIMKGVNCIIYRHKTDDIYKRASFLRARLLLATDM